MSDASASGTRAGLIPELEHLGFEVDRDNSVTVHVRQPGQMFGLTLQQALRRIDEFKSADQARILRALSCFYNILACGEVCRACGRPHHICPNTGASISTTL